MALHIVNTDSSGQRYVEIDFPGGDPERLRLTLIPASASRGGKAIRLQIRNDRGLHQGPEIHIDAAKGIASAIMDLLEV